MNATPRYSLCSLVLAAAIASAGCSDILRQDRSAVMLVIDRLEASSGPSTTFGGTLQSDVITIVDDSPTVFSDSGRVTMRLLLKDVFETPTAINAVTINRYRVSFRRSDGRNTPGVDVPQPFDSAISFTVAPGSTVTTTFELIRHVAKFESPLRALAVNTSVTISTIADVTFFGRDLTGNELSTTGSIGVAFGDFGDPD